ncbi:hypothetical protein PVAP13_7KG011100 [Panicum virgatum]|uniref:Secreted protein n=1 Tax=Panicum virgatum TaxID=38727 RepID=A0A8T0QD73_PANVG|nr:hypothetical protein PVAP13_7KG011100 [Panicum virgatum]
MVKTAHLILLRAAVTGAVLAQRWRWWPKWRRRWFGIALAGLDMDDGDGAGGGWWGWRVSRWSGSMRARARSGRRSGSWRRGFRRRRCPSGGLWRRR